MIHSQTLTRRFAQIVATIQLLAGITGMILSSRFGGVSYKPARDLLSFLPGNAGSWWSGLLVLLALIALVSLQLRLTLTRTAFALLCGYWGFWLVLWTVALTDRGAGPWAPFLAAIIVVGNARPVFAPSVN